jgi:hypothetical protein
MRKLAIGTLAAALLLSIAALSGDKGHLVTVKAGLRSSQTARLSHVRRCYFCSSDGNPALVVAFIRAFVSVFASSYVTMACFFSY